jgi:hypothetical protein
MALKGSPHFIFGEFMATQQQSKIADFFKLNTPNQNQGLVVPEIPVFCKNDCKEGRWMIGESEYGNKMEMLILNFSKRIQDINLYSVREATPQEYRRIAQGQVWFTPISGEIPGNIIYYTLIKNSKSGKSGSLKNFAQQLAIAQSLGFTDPRQLVWMPRFVKRSGAIPDENGVMQSATWYVLDWAFREVEAKELPALENCVGVMSDPEQMAMLYDPDLEGDSICVDGLSPQQVSALLRGGEPLAMLPPAGDGRLTSPDE